MRACPDVTKRGKGGKKKREKERERGGKDKSEKERPESGRKASNEDTNTEFLFA